MTELNGRRSWRQQPEGLPRSSHRREYLTASVDNLEEGAVCYVSGRLVRVILRVGAARAVAARSSDPKVARPGVEDNLKRLARGADLDLAVVLSFEGITWNGRDPGEVRR